MTRVSPFRLLLPLLWLVPIALIVPILLGVLTPFIFVVWVIDVPWRLKQIRQVRALPRSKARSVAIGLAEFEGMARATGADGGITKPGAKAAQPFYLEDETGRILVDPVDAAVRPRSTSGASLRLNEVEEGLRDGDRVYVIGNVQSRATRLSDALDADRLVIRPLRQRLVASPVGRLLFPERNQPADRDASNIFIVDRGRGHDVILRLRLALWDFCIVAVVYLAASLWLVQAAWPWLAPVDHYRALFISLIQGAQ